MTNEFIARDVDSIAIAAIGATAEEAIAAAIRDAGPFEDAEGKALTFEQASEKFVAMPATPALIKMVEEYGGAIAWDEEGGIARTWDEAGE